MTNHTTTSDHNVSGAIEPIAPTRDQAKRHNKAEGAVIPLIALTAIALIYALWCSMEHSDQIPTAIVLFVAALGAAVLTKQFATALQYDHDRRAAAAGLHHAICEAQQQQLTVAATAMRAQHDATVAAVRDEMTRQVQAALADLNGRMDARAHATLVDCRRIAQEELTVGRAETTANMGKIFERIDDAIAKADWGAYSKGWRDRGIADEMQAKGRVNGKVTYLPKDRTPS